jgi:hypothetical protein
MQGSELLIDEEEERKAKKQLSSLREKPSDVIAGFLVICDSSFARQVVSKSKTGSDWKVAFHVNCAPELGFAPSLSLETVSVKYKVCSFYWEEIVSHCFFFRLRIRWSSWSSSEQLRERSSNESRLMKKGRFV